MTAPRRLAGLLLLALFALAPGLAPTTALAHAGLIATDPADGGALEAMPHGFSVTFTEPVAPTTLTLTGPDGAATALAGSRLEGNRLVIDAPPAPAAGWAHGPYVLSWRVTSEDGHPVGGAVLFHLGSDAAASTGEAALLAKAGGGPPPALMITLWACRILIYGGLVAGLGILAFAAAADSKLGAGTRSLTAVLLMTGFAATILALGLQGLDALGAGFGALAHKTTWQAGLATSYGRTVIIALIAQAMGLLSLAPQSRLLGLAALAAGALALAVSGHAASAPPQWLSRPAVFLHSGAAAFWVGGLVVLLAALKGPADEARRLLAFFSRRIAPAIAVLIAGGATLTLLQLASPADLWRTGYGRLLSAKLVLVLVLLAIAAFNRWRLTSPALGGGNAEACGARQTLKRIIGLELLLVAALLTVVAGWRFTPPPRALAAAEAATTAARLTAQAPKQIALKAEGYTLYITFDEGVTTAPMPVSAMLHDADDVMLDPMEIRLEFASPAAGIGALSRALAPSSDGMWQLSDLQLPVPGLWQVKAAALISDFKQVRFEGEVQVSP
ncbi:copper resistance CopC/CopD family protein [Radicibacter daui]|uniref:copper resistance CopC/CopD family protein n=1 Tax=Radicibacter daui TaxID=3064829 RepID=UPI004047002E